MKVRSPRSLVCVLFLVFAGRVAWAAEHVAVLELGADTESDLPPAGSRLGPSLAVEVTPIDEWLELELGLAALKSRHATHWETDFLFKKPWTLSSTIEFMVGLGPTWTRVSQPTGVTSTAGAELALDFMFWRTQRWGWYLEPSYGVDFARGHGQSVGISFGILFGVHGKGRAEMTQ